MTLIVPRFAIKKSKNLNTVIECSFNDVEFSLRAKNAAFDENFTSRYSRLTKVAKN